MQQIALYIALLLIGMAAGVLLCAPTILSLKAKLEPFTAPRKRDALGRFVSEVA